MKNNQAIIQKQIEEGRIVVEESTDGSKSYRNRNLKELLEWKLSTKVMTKKDILAHLQSVASNAKGQRERTRADGLIPYFKNLNVKEAQSAS